MGIETLAIGSLAASAGSGILGAFGAKAKGDADAAAYNYKAQVAANNAIIAEQNAAQTTYAGRVGAQSNDLKTKNLVATQLVTQASKGLDVNSGSNVAVRQSAEDLGHLDTLTILSNAAKNSAGFKAQGMNFQAESALDRSAAENAEKAGTIGAFSSLLGGASSFSDKWIGYSNKGVF